MFEEVTGLPAHPLFVHAPIILVPLLALVGVVYVLIPPLRRKLDWALVPLAVAAPASVWAARMSGEAFQARLAGKDMMPPELADAVAVHAGHSWVLWWLALALGGVSLLLVLSDLFLGQREPVDFEAEAAGTGKRTGVFRIIVIVLLGLGLLGLAGASGWYVYQTGHTGGSMVWEGS
ncbi:MAG: hypothetical protein ACRDT8_02030 [Micromonosporaceae bacterium]